jgi:hypothetical protein
MQLRILYKNSIIRRFAASAAVQPTANNPIKAGDGPEASKEKKVQQSAVRLSFTPNSRLR